MANWIPLNINSLQKLWLEELGIETTIFPNWKLQKLEELRPSFLSKNHSYFPIINSKSSIVYNKQSLKQQFISNRAITNDFERLRHLVMTCTACNLCKTRKNVVFGTGNTEIRWMIIGEAPGEKEDLNGLPFVGRSGNLVDEMLDAIGKKRKNNIFITNVVKCRPPGNRNPNFQELQTCKQYLMRQIELLKPEKIFTMGRFAAQVILNTNTSITNLRGKTHYLKLNNGSIIPVIVTYHPAFLLRSPSNKAYAWEDLNILRK